MEIENDEITSAKPKNQGRVEWGKKLGKMSKERKLKKETEHAKEVRTYKYDFNYFAKSACSIVGPVSFLLIGVASYWVYAKITKPSKQIKVKRPHEEIPKSKFSDF